MTDEPGSEVISACCDAPITDTGFCTFCGEHA